MQLTRFSDPRVWMGLWDPDPTVTPSSSRRRRSIYHLVEEVIWKRPARVDGWSDPDPMATLWPAEPGPPGPPGPPAEFPNRLFLFLMISPKIIIFGYFCQNLYYYAETMGGQK